MVALKYLTPLRFCTVLAVLLATDALATAGEENSPCEVHVKGHSIVHLTLIEKTGR